MSILDALPEPMDATEFRPKIEALKTQLDRIEALLNSMAIQNKKKEPE